MADEDEILRCAQDDTVKQIRKMRISADLSAQWHPMHIRVNLLNLIIASLR